MQLWTANLSSCWEFGATFRVYAMTKKFVHNYYYGIVTIAVSNAVYVGMPIAMYFNLLA